MAKGPKIKIDTKPFETALHRYMEGSRREIGTVLKQQLRVFSRDMVDLTPPARGSTRGVAAKKSGEKAVEGDIRNAFEPVHPNRADITYSEMPRVVKSLRQGGKKRIKHRVPNARKASRGDITKLVKARKKKVGMLGAAWVKAGRSAFGKVAAPAWISRHMGRTKGFGKFRQALNRAFAEVTNAVSFAGNIHGLQRRAQFALNAQARKMNAQVDHRLEQQAKKNRL